MKRLMLASGNLPPLLLSAPAMVEENSDSVVDSTPRGELQGGEQQMEAGSKATVSQTEY